MIRFQCPVCDKVLKAPDHGAGQKISCPKCGQRLLIPQPAPAANKTVLGRSLPESSSSSVPPSMASSSAASLTATCPGCGRSIPLELHEIGWTIECKVCKTCFVLAEPPAPSLTPTKQPSAPMSVSKGSGRSGSKSVIFKVLLLIGVLGVLGILGCMVVGGLAVGGVLFSIGSASLPSSPAALHLGEPATCRELAEKLKAKGAIEDWTNCRYPRNLSQKEYPAIIVTSGGMGVNTARLWYDQGVLHNDYVIIVQFATPDEASEKAGTREEAFSYGRFMIFGGPNLVNEIRHKL